MLAGMILGAVFVISALMLFATGRHIRNREPHFVGLSVLGFLAASTIASVVIYFDSGEWSLDDRRFSSGLSMAEVDAVASALAPSEPAVPAPAVGSTQVGSVQSLLDGLREKLESDPENSSGWALLAQSYAFTGDIELAEDALSHAVALGVDEADLRRRVDSARRDPHISLNLPR